MAHIWKVRFCTRYFFVGVNFVGSTKKKRKKKKLVWGEAGLEISQLLVSHFGRISSKHQTPKRHQRSKPEIASMYKGRSYTHSEDININIHQGPSRDNRQIILKRASIYCKSNQFCVRSMTTVVAKCHFSPCPIAPDAKWTASQSTVRQHIGLHWLLNSLAHLRV